MAQSELQKKHRSLRAATKTTRFLQAMIGVGLALLSVLKLLLWGAVVLGGIEAIKYEWMKHLHNEPTLKLIADGLLGSAALELAYMLLTPDLDEAVDPLILGLAATILLRIEAARQAQDVLVLAHASQIAIYVIALAGLFAIREIFIRRRWFR